MEDVIRGYFDACNTGDADAVAKFFAPGAVHYFPPDMYDGPFRGGETIGAKWSWAVRTLGSRWTVDEIICDPDTDRAVIEWTHEKTKAGVVLRIETVINNPKDFLVHRSRQKQDGSEEVGWFPMTKGVANLYR